ncbi:MAG: IS4 family transposase [Nanoarchaeota archaeon]|nr:IS4 family transposase [Nanoarchaeota archaeon]
MKIIETIKNEIYNVDFMNKSKNNEHDFTINRKLCFSSLIIFMLNSIKSTIQKELTNFIELISGSSDNTKRISKSAFSQSRSKLNPEAFIHLNNILNKEFYTDNDYSTWEGHRVLSVDGSTCQLPYSEKLKNHFGHVTGHNSRNFPIARISCLYDILNDITIDSKIAPIEIGEYSLISQHIDKIQENDLLVMDRGYGAIWLFYLIIQKGGDFVTRLQKNFIKEADDFRESNEYSKIIEIKDFHYKSKNQLNKLGIEFKAFKIRLVKVILENGEIEILATSLIEEEKYSTTIFKDLYFTRWGIEINYDHLKNQVEIENFSGRTVLAIEQDFYANMLMANFQSLIIRDAKEEMDKTNKNCEYEYKINKNLSFSYMKDRFIKILLSDDSNYFEQLKELFKVEPIPIRKGRKFKRDIRTRKKKYFLNKRRAV